MSHLNPGNIVAFPLRDDRFGIAKVVVREDLALHNAYHFVIYDVVLDELPREIDLHGLPLDQPHGLEDVEDLPVVVNHVGIVSEGLAAGEVVVVGHNEPNDEEFDGYRVWLSLMRDDARRRGLIRYESNEKEAVDTDRDDEYEVVDEEGYDREEVGDEVSGSDESDGAEEQESGDADADRRRPEIVDPPAGASPEPAEEGEPKPDDETVMEIDGRDVPIHPWHYYVGSLPIGALLFQWHDVFEKPALKSTRLGDFICSFYDERSEAIVAELVERLEEGDYSAGHELLEYGERAVGALKRLLADGTTPEKAADTLQILADIGSEQANEEIAAFFAKHYMSSDEEISLTASRAYLYALMGTAGRSPALWAHREKIDEISHPELRSDVRDALRAIINYDGPGMVPPAVAPKHTTPWEE